MKQAMIEAIDNVGFQPFLTLGVSGADGALDLAVCYTQQEVDSFCAYVRQTAGAASDRFRAGLLAALSGEAYDAMEAWFAWIAGDDEAAEGTPHVRVRLYAHDGAPWSFYAGYPLIELTLDGGPQSEKERAEAIAGIVEGFADTSGNDLCRWLLIEAGALALSKHYGSRGKHADALDYVDMGLAARPYSMHLKAAKFALEQVLAGKPAPARLVKFIDRDNGYLEGFTCAQPWIRFDIGPTGDTLVCCGHWLDKSIGNVVADPAEAVLNSDTAVAIRKSMLDGTYKYCNHLDCMEMINDQLPTIERARETLPFIRRAVEEGDYRVERLESMLFALDQTCNLTCPSCRTEKIVENLKQNTTKLHAIDEHIVPVLKGLKHLNINPAGELFASKTSRRLLEHVGTEHAPDVVLDIISNGTLFNAKEWARYPNIHGRIRSIRISTDAATKETFEKLRRLGKWEVFLENIAFLGQLRVTGALGEFESRHGQYRFSFTYQLDNFREMPDFVRFVRAHHGTSAVFERLQNLGAYSDEEFRRLAVHLPSNPHHEEFLAVIRDPILHSPDVYGDFGEFLRDVEQPAGLGVEEAGVTAYVGA